MLIVHPIKKPKRWAARDAHPIARVDPSSLLWRLGSSSSLAAICKHLPNRTCPAGGTTHTKPNHLIKISEPLTTYLHPSASRLLPDTGK